MAFCCKTVDHESPWGLSHALDHIEWKIESASKKNKVDRQFIREVGIDRDTCEIFFDTLSKNPSFEAHADHIRDKFFRLNQKITTLIASENRTLNEAIQLLQKKDGAGFKTSIETLPIPFQHQLFRKHWEMMGQPLKTSEDSYLRSIAHDDFGRVSLLGIVNHCSVTDEQRIRTLNALIGTGR
jgi:hypothetical protein